MPLKWTPTLADSTATVALSLPMRPWSRPLSSVGGFRKVVSGARESFELRADRHLRLTLRAHESELQALEAFVERRRAAAGVSWTLTLTAGGTAHSVYLESPKAGETWEPTRGEYPGTWEVSIEVSRADGLAFGETYY